MSTVEIRDHTITIVLFADEFEVEVAIMRTGAYRSATREDPPETPDFELLHVRLMGRDILPYLSSESENEIYGLIEDQYND